MGRKNLNTVTQRFAQADERTKEFYYYIGLLSTRFAILESNVLDLLGKLLLDDFVVANTILERNTLAQNIDLLKKINKYRRFEEDRIGILIEQIMRVKSNRNLFIHGVWSEPYMLENDIAVNCSEPKLLYEEKLQSRRWSSSRNHTFRIGYIKKQVQQIDEIIFGQNHIIGKIEEFNQDPNNQW